MKITKDHKELMTSMGVEYNQFKQLCEAIRVGLEFTPLYEREKGIVLGVLEGGKTFVDIGKDYDITAERVRQIYCKAIRRLRYAFQQYVAEQDKLHKELQRLRTENLSLRMIIKDANLDETKRNDFTTEQAGILTTPIENLDMSIRAKNCLRSAELYTLSEVLQIPIRDMLKFRHFGKKSLGEIKGIFDKLGINWE